MSFFDRTGKDPVLSAFSGRPSPTPPIATSPPPGYHVPPSRSMTDSMGVRGLRKAYNPDQPREADGTWGSTGAVNVKTLYEEREHDGTSDFEDRTVSANNHAKKVLQRARREEPKISKLLNAHLPPGGTLEGFKFRLKGEKSLTRKIRDDAKTDGITQAQAAAKIGDAVRYTAQLPAASYKDGVKSMLDDLMAKGHKVVKFGNTWAQGDGPTPVYQGVNTNLVSPTGLKYELQFHTKESLETKEVLNHKDYELARSQGVSRKEKEEAETRMVANQKRVPRPPGLDGFSYPTVKA